jgi:hypothetical protein
MKSNWIAVLGIAVIAAVMGAALTSGVLSPALVILLAAAMGLAAAGWAYRDRLRKSES